MKTIQFLFIGILLLAFHGLKAQDQQNIKHTIDSKIFDAERQILVFLLD